MQLKLLQHPGRRQRLCVVTENRLLTGLFPSAQLGGQAPVQPQGHLRDAIPRQTLRLHSLTLQPHHQLLRRGRCSQREN